MVKDHLSIDAFYPDCPNCEHNVLVTRRDGGFYCYWCGSLFTEAWPWHALKRLSEKEQSLYKRVEIQGASIGEAASPLGLTKQQASGHLLNARTRMNAARRVMGD